MTKRTLALMGVWALGAALGQADTFFVDASRPDDSGDGASWATAKKTLQAAVNLAVTPGDTVWATNGVYALGSAVAGGTSNIVALSTNVTLRSLNGPEVTIIDGGNAVRCVYVPTNAILDGFTIRNGYILYPLRGAGICVTNGGFVSNCIIENNFLDYPGGTAAQTGGGGVVLERGGALEYCVIRNNVAEVNGGGVNCQYGGLVRNCLIYGNSGFRGGGLFILGAGKMISCTLSGNSSLSGSGSGLRADVATNATLINNMIYGNSGTEWVSTTLNSTSVWNNCTTPAMGVNGVTNAPLYVDAANKNYRLAFGSPGIDAGTNMPVALDLDGITRPVDGNLDGIATWDIGAYEFVPATNPPELFIESPSDLELFPWTITNRTAQGAGHDLTGHLSWTNEATGAYGELTAGSPWTVSGIDLAVGTNRWTLSGSNVYGQVTQATVRIMRGGFETPAVVPATNLLAQPCSVVLLSGTNNAHVAGILSWSNVANGLSGAQAATPVWTTTVARLNDGDNPVVFSGTNLLGETASATVTVTRTAYLVRYVSPSGSGQPPYTNWATAATNLQTAVAAAQDGDEVVVTSGTWAVDGPLNITNGIVVRSAPNSTAIIVPASFHRCVTMNHPAAILDGLWIRNGYLYEDEGTGAGILCQDGTIQNCIVANCYSFDGGGGVHMVRGNLQQCTIVSNRTWYWIATGIRCDANASVANCIIRYNNPLGQGEYNVQNFGATIVNCATMPEVGTGCITNDPLFVNREGNDFRLKGVSPCIDAGTDLSPWTDRDIAGRLRPLVGPAGLPARFDIGAHEFVPVIMASGGAHGTIAPTGEIVVGYGSSTSFLVTADAYYHIAALLTNASADAAAEGRGVYTSQWDNVTAYGSVSALFAENLAALGTPEWWLAQYGWTNDFDYWETNDTDTDTFQAWEEQIAGTDPTNNASYLKVSGFGVQGSGRTLAWPAASGRVYSVDINTNSLVTGHWSPVTNNLPPIGVWTDTAHGEDALIHYRLGVQREP